MTQLHLCIGSWKTTKIFPSSKLCKQRHQRGGGQREKGNKSEECKRILKRKSYTKEGPREERGVFIPRLGSRWHTAVYKPLDPGSRPGGKKGSRNFINTLQINVSGQYTFQRSSWESVGGCLWSDASGSWGPHLELED